MEDYDKSHEGAIAEPGAKFGDCDCGSQVKLIDTNEMGTMDTEAFLLFWYNKELDCISVVQHMQMTAEGAEELAQILSTWTMRTIARMLQLKEE